MRTAFILSVSLAGISLMLAIVGSSLLYALHLDHHGLRPNLPRTDWTTEVTAPESVTDLRDACALLARLYESSRKHAEAQGTLFDQLSFLAGMFLVVWGGLSCLASSYIGLRVWKYREKDG